jgi:hypothetical protein
MNSGPTATSSPSLCRQHRQHGRKCEAQEVSWSRTNKQLEAWLRPRPRITGSSAEKLALIGMTSACWVQSRTERTEGGAMYRLREGFSFFLANSHNRSSWQQVWILWGDALCTRTPYGPRGWRQERFYRINDSRPAWPASWKHSRSGRAMPSRKRRAAGDRPRGSIASWRTRGCDPPPCIRVSPGTRPSSAWSRPPCWWSKTPPR